MDHKDGTPISDYSFELAGGPIGILLVHGLTGTPAEMRVLARGLNQAGYTVHAVQLAGHCGTVDDLLATTWQDWYASVCEAAQRLAACTERFFVGGLSMGAVLALKYAADHPGRAAGVMAYAPVFMHDGWSFPLYTRAGSWLLPGFKRLNIGRHQVSQEKPPYGIKDAALRKRIVAHMQSGQSGQAGLSGTPWFALAEMYGLVARVRRQLKSVASPCLVVHSVEDDVASARNARLILRGMRQAPVHMLWLHDSYHMVTIDRERRDVIRGTIDFVEGNLQSGFAPRQENPGAPRPSDLSDQRPSQTIQEQVIA